MRNQIKQQLGPIIVCALIAAAVLLAFVPHSQAQNAPATAAPTGQASFSVLDVNQDGAIDKKEAAASAAVAKVFDVADANKDGVLSPEEYAKAATAK
ncbi:hypothetical protein [Propionivibrio sp.]|jgi:hypothetical protein|uniref:hypothetical protein n=1 Tax=Propionivibrio sp. TaxID=2212460 RepID=UPI00272E9E61|nr:hypothetical protein [Propionivibrio sp.]